MKKKSQMFRNYYPTWLLVLALIVSGCSVDNNQTTGVTPSPQSESVPATQPNATPSPSLPPGHILVTWADLNLTGRLVYIMGVVEDNVFYMSVQMLDLVTGEITTVFKAPQNSLIDYITVSPDNKQIVMTYSPPIESSDGINQVLYTMPLGGSRPPELLFAPPTKDDHYIQVEWSPDGKYIYYTHVNYQIPTDPNRVYPLYTIYRMEYPDGQPEKIADQAYWPRLSSDSSRLVYVSVDPLSVTHKLSVANSDGSNAQEVVLSGSWLPDIKDAPIFAPDGQSIIFSAPPPVQSHQPNWLEKLMGIGVVKANGDVLSDWWSVPITGGEPTQLTHLQTFGLYASVSPDKEYVASFSRGGIFVMKPDGSNLTVIIPNTESVPGTVSWIP